MTQIRKKEERGADRERERNSLYEGMQYNCSMLFVHEDCLNSDYNWELEFKTLRTGAGIHLPYPRNAHRAYGLNIGTMRAYDWVRGRKGWEGRGGGGLVT